MDKRYRFGRLEPVSFAEKVDVVGGQVDFRAGTASMQIHWVDATGAVVKAETLQASDLTNVDGVVAGLTRGERTTFHELLLSLLPVLHHSLPSGVVS